MSAAPPRNGGQRRDIARDELVGYLDDLLSISAGGDWCPNGLQIEGCQAIRHLVTGVSACQALFDRAREAGADAILVHHGLFWDGGPTSLVGVHGRRVRTMVEANMSLLAYHLPLDRHLVFGNNAVAARLLGLCDVQPFAEAKGQPVGVRGRFDPAIGDSELVRRVEALYRQAPLHFAGGPPTIVSIGIVSGGAASEVYTALDAGLDAFVTGEPREWVMSLAREAGIHVITAGHHATERLGPRALGEHVAERFGIQVTFIDVPNPA